MTLAAVGEAFRLGIRFEASCTLVL